MRHTGPESARPTIRLPAMSVAVVHTIPDLHAVLDDRRPALVPTMGALHVGHAALIRRARETAGVGAPVVVSIFVNPTQFAPNEDFSRYPRQLERDVAICEQSGANVIFAPDVQEVYPAGPASVADGFVMPALPAVATQPRLEDAFRPTHFAGVCKVVARLFDIVQPAFVIFGEKDYQQLRVISDMIAEHAHRWPRLKIIPHVTIRAPDGLAMSSRNVYLKPDQRERALGLSRALNQAQASSLEAAELIMRHLLEQHNLTIDYAVLRDAYTLLAPSAGDRPMRCLIAARLESVRLIDNMAFSQGETD
jgi:pantoate--beta-alanine ligase